MPEIYFRNMQRRDIARVHEIEKLSFTTPWSYASLLGELKNSAALYIVGHVDSLLCAYAGMWVLFDEAHITNVAVAPQMRGQGIGRAIMLEMMRAAYNTRGAAYMTLEVREKNHVAQNLYHSLGFKKEGVRPKYYTDTGEDGYILWTKLNPNLFEKGE